MPNVFQQIAKLASGAVNVHIYGRTGTGKQIVAAIIHQLGGRNNYPLITIDCAEYHKRDMWSKCFEAEKSLAAKAEKHVHAFLHLADRGTLILHNINYMGLGLQQKLLQVIKQATDHADVPIPLPRIITTSCCDPQTFLRHGTIKPLLFQQLSPSLFNLKPLRDCKEDLPALADYYFNYYNLSPIKQVLPKSIMQQLLDYDWPGNLYELQNTIQRYAVYNEIIFLSVKTELNRENPTVGKLRRLSTRKPETQRTRVKLRSHFIHPGFSLSSLDPKIAKSSK